MGQNVSEQCRCQDVLKLCAPDDPSVEEKSQIKATSGQSYPQTLSEQGLDPSRNFHGQPTATGQGGARAQNSHPGWESDLGQDDPLGFLPPPPVHYDDTADGFLPPPPAPTGGGSSPSPANHRTGGGGGASPPAAGAAVAGLAQRVSLDAILSDLEGAEQTAYSEVFLGFGGGGSGPNFVGFDNAHCREFLVSHSRLTLNDVDMEILKGGSETMDDGLSLDGFLEIMRTCAIDDADPIGAFYSASQDGQHMGATECRDFLLLQAQQKLYVNYSEDRFDQIFTMVMMQAGVQITMEELVAYCGRMTRMVRLMELCGH